MPTEGVNSHGSGAKILDIECLRAVAILFTLLAHVRFSYAWTPDWISSLDRTAHFWGGVDLFFVISGFVISRSLIPSFRALQPGASHVPYVTAFWVRRVFRLWPASWLWAGLGLLTVAAVQRDVLWANAIDVLHALLQVYNVHAYACAQGTATCSHQAVGVYWSLSLEEQFYIFLPVLLVTLRERAKWVLVALVFLSFPINAAWGGLAGFFRWEGFCFGVLLAWVHARPERARQVRDQFIVPLGRFGPLLSLLFLVAIPLFSNGGVGPLLTYPLIAVLSALWVGLASFDVNAIGVPGVLRPVLVYIGARSYSIYLAHVPVLLVFRYFSGKVELQHGWQHAMWALAATVVIVACSELTYRFVEQRFRGMGRKAEARTAATPAAVSGA